MIELQGLTRRYGDTLAVDHLDTVIAPGRVTGFLGPNGAGKSTTMRAVLGLDRPSSGRALVLGVPYRELGEPVRHVGALLDADAVHPGRTARHHLVAVARSNGIPTRRVDEVLEQVGLAGKARRRVRTYSLGMKQRLGIAGALLGDPQVLLFDEPVNGLDPDGVRWIRDLLRGLADEGRTVLVSSHLMSEMQQTADHLLVIGRGRLLADGPLDEVISAAVHASVRVRTPRADDLAARLRAEGFGVARDDDHQLTVTGADIARVGDAAYALGAPVHELTEQRSSLEQAYLHLTADSVEHVSRPTGPAPSEQPVPVRDLAEVQP